MKAAGNMTEKTGELQCILLTHRMNRCKKDNLNDHQRVLKDRHEVVVKAYLLQFTSRHPGAFLETILRIDPVSMLMKMVLTMLKG